MRLNTLVIFIICSAISVAQSYQIDWHVIGSGGGHTESASYQIDGTVGQAIVGTSTSENYRVDAGFWIGAGSTIAPEFMYLPGDANMFAGLWPPAVIGGDVTFLVNYFRGQSTPCLLDGFYAAGDANGDCVVIGGDVTYLVNYFRGLNVLNDCLDYESVWPPVPPDAPPGWPNCDNSSMANGSKVIREVSKGR